MNFSLVIGAIAGFLGVALGAFGAHALRHRLPPEKLAVFQTGVQYQMYHALALLGCGIVIAGRWTSAVRSVDTAGWCFAVGIALFSGSLYLLSITGKRWLGPITPLGGLSFLAGWLFFFQAILHI